MELPSEIQEMRDTTRKLVSDLLQHEPVFHRTNVVPPEADQAFKELGYYGMRIPETFGGMGLGMLPTVAIVSELGRLPPQFWSFLRVALGPSSKALIKHGTEEQRKRWLPAIERLVKLRVTRSRTNSLNAQCPSR